MIYTESSDYSTSASWKTQIKGTVLLGLRAMLMSCLTSAWTVALCVFLCAWIVTKCVGDIELSDEAAISATLAIQWALVLALILWMMAIHHTLEDAYYKLEKFQVVVFAIVKISLLLGSIWTVGALQMGII